MLAAGDAVDDVLEAFPSLHREQVLDCMDHAARLMGSLSSPSNPLQPTPLTRRDWQPLKSEFLAVFRARFSAKNREASDSDP